MVSTRFLIEYSITFTERIALLRSLDNQVFMFFFYLSLSGRIKAKDVNFSFLPTLHKFRLNYFFLSKTIIFTNILRKWFPPVLIQCVSGSPPEDLRNLRNLRTLLDKNKYAHTNQPFLDKESGISTYIVLLYLFVFKEDLASFMK